LRHVRRKDNAFVAALDGSKHDNLLETGGLFMIRSILAVLLIVSAPGLADARPHRHHVAHHNFGPSSGTHYTNVDGNSIHSPMHSRGRPAGATAHCADGSWSFSQHARALVRTMAA
jgi:hypothetical protein